MGGRRMRPNRLLVSHCLLYLVPTFAAALSMCNNQAPAESVSRPDSPVSGTVCSIPVLRGNSLRRPVGCCHFCRDMNETLPDKTPCYAIPPLEALRMKPHARRTCPLGLCENGVCKPTGKYEICETIATIKKM
uniref:Evasin n=1 Tax=Rhipicephalus zambeziensis TaxID=60191 RepID=A0A224Y3D0_9ACAR